MQAFFTGHRKIDSSVQSGIEQLIAIATEQGTQHFFIGMALGTDQLAAEILTKMQLSWTAVIPCRDQDSLWPLAQKRKYHQLQENASEVIYLAERYYQGCLNQRNLWMVQRSQLCLSVWDGRTNGGTFHAVTSARKRSLNIINFNPQTHTIEYPFDLQLSLF